SEFDQPPRQSDWEHGEDIFVQIDAIRDNGNIDLSISSRQLEGHFREILVQTPNGEQLKKTSELNRRETEIDSETQRKQNGSIDRLDSTKSTSGEQTVQFTNGVKDSEFPWLDYPNHGWKVPCPACNQNILNEFSAFKDHWQDNAECSGPVAVNDSTWRKLGVNPAEIQQTSKSRIDQSSSDVQHDTSNQIDKGSLPDSTGFPLFGSDRDQMRV
ncbi:hypothetical protein PM085_20685, partial [Halorubrum ezzemoulense]|nr:hypothetical protein [Halorubrum ezzemoulense]